MTREVVLLRAVNVGGRTLSMAELRRGLEAAGCTEVATYIQSGNVVLEPPTGLRGDPTVWLEEHIAAVAGFPVPVVRRTADELARTVADNPFPGAGGKLLHVVFLAEEPPPGALDGVEAVAPEAFGLVGRDLYMHLPDGMGRSKLPVALGRALDRAGAAAGTSRNWNTVLRLLELATA